MVMKNWTKKRRLTKIASMYYLDNMTQSQIAREMGIDRSSVSKLLKEARELEIVTISIKSDSYKHINLENEIKKKYGLKDVIVVETSTNDQKQSKVELGIIAAEYFLEILTAQSIVGLSGVRRLLNLQKRSKKLVM